MEKFSKWRDKGTGIQAFLRPVPPIQTTATPIWQYSILPLTFILALARTLLYLVLMGLKLLLGDVLLLISATPKLHEPLLHATTWLCCRLALVVMGFYYIPVEHSVSLKRSSGRTQLPPVHPQKGDLIISNWSSYIEILYLAARYNATLLQPILSPAGQVLGYKRVGVFRIQTLCGQPPVVAATKPKSAKSLQEWLIKSNAPVAIFPELTTSNNRAILRFADLSSCRPPAGLPPVNPQVFLFYFKHDMPSFLQNTATLPIPYFLNPFLHFFLLGQAILPRTMSARSLHPTETPRANLGSSDFWTACEEALALLGKTRVTKGVGWQDKAPFLEYYKRSKR